MNSNAAVQTAMALDKANAAVYSQVDGLSLQNLFYVKNGSFPNCFMFTRPARSEDMYFDTPSMLEFFKKNVPADEQMQYIVYSKFNLETMEENIGFSIILNKSNIFARLERSVGESYVLYGNGDRMALDHFIQAVRRFYVYPEQEKNNMFMVAQDANGFRLNKWFINEIEDFDIRRQYNDDFVEADAIMDDFLSEEGKSGLMILHGEKGTGKSSYIRNLIARFPNKKFIFIPSSILPLLNAPAFGKFLLTLADSVLILEDCENVIQSRNRGDNGAVSLLLNLCDGLMSDYLGIKCICTFNADIKDIDEALLRKGRLVCEYEFKKLSAKKVAVLLPEVVRQKIEKLELQKVQCELEGKLDKAARQQKKIDKLNQILAADIQEDMTLADIYNVEECSFLKECKRIGF